MVSQERLLVPMLRSGWVSPLDALRHCNCFRLSARIYDLRGRYEIRSKRIKVGSGKIVAAYHIVGAKR